MAVEEISCPKCGAPVELTSAPGLRCSFCQTPLQRKEPTTYGATHVPVANYKMVALFMVVPTVIALGAGLFGVIFSVTQGSLPGVPSLNGFLSATSVCLVDANGDGVDDAAVFGYADEAVRVGIIDGADGSVMWKNADPDGQLVCLSRDWFLVAYDDFRLQFYNARTPDPPIRVRGSDTLRESGFGEGCVRFATADDQIAGVTLPGGAATECVATMNRWSDEPGNVMGLTDDECSFTAQTRVYRLTTRAHGTEILTVTALEGGVSLWSKELPYAKPKFGSAIFAVQGRVVTLGTPPGEDTMHLIGLDETTGNQLYDVPLDSIGADETNFMGFNGRFLVVQYSAAVGAFNIETGEQVWSVGG